MRLTLRQRRAAWAYLFLSLPILFFATIRLAPALFAFNVSLHQWNILAPAKPWVGLDNFRALLADPVFARATLNTFLYVVLGVPSQLALGLVVALLLQGVVRWAGLFRAIYFLPFVTTSAAVAWVWRWLYMTPEGVLNQILLLLHLSPHRFLGSPDEALYSILAVVVWEGIGFTAIIYLAGLESIPGASYEAAAIDGAVGWQRFRHVTWPLLNTTTVFLAVTGTIRFLQVFTEIQNMSSEGTGGPLNSTISLVLYIYQQAFVHFQMGYASALTVVLFLMILVVTLVQLRIVQRHVEY